MALGGEYCSLEPLSGDGAAPLYSCLGDTRGESATRTQAPPRPRNPGFLVSALFSGLPGPDCVGFFSWNGICLLIRALGKTYSMFHFYIYGLISNSILFNNG